MSNITRFVLLGKTKALKAKSLINNIQNLVMVEKVKIKDIEERIRSKSGAREFFEQKLNSYLPEDATYNSRFIKDVLAGIKKLIPLDKSNCPSLGKLKDNKEFDKPYLLSIIKNNQTMMCYIPDNTDYKNISRETMLKVSIFS